jgi:hypothetical protein
MKRHPLPKPERLMRENLWLRVQSAVLLLACIDLIRKKISIDVSINTILPKDKITN